MKGVRKVEHVRGHSTEVRRIKQMNKIEEIEKQRDYENKTVQ